MKWLACLGGDDDRHAQQQLEAALAMIDAYEQAAASPIASVGGSSAAECSATASEDGEAMISRTDSSCSSSQGEAADRVARKNRARLERYHRSKAELTGLRQEAGKLQAILNGLLMTKRVLPSPSLRSSPCPFVDNARDEIDPSEHAWPAPAFRGDEDWKGVARREWKRRQRSQVVRLKLKWLIHKYKAQTDVFIKELSRAQGQTSAGKRPVAIPREVPSLLGADSLEAFTYSGVAVLSELYHLACSSYGIAPAGTACLSKSGGELAYSSLLGQAIESGWTHVCELPGNDPCSVAVQVVRAITSQPPQRMVVKEAIKHHNTIHPLFERRFTLRHQLADGGAVDFECAMLMQTYEADDSAVIVWALSVHGGDSSAPPPVFRSSGWYAFQPFPSDCQGASGQITARSTARVHWAPTATLARVNPAVSRRHMVDAWSSAIRIKQQDMSSRLLLLL